MSTWALAPSGMVAAVIVGAAVSVTVMVALLLVTSDEPGAFTITRYCAPVSLATSGPVLQVLLVAPAATTFVHTAPPAFRCPTQDSSPAAGAPVIVTITDKVARLPALTVRLP